VTLKVWLLTFKETYRHSKRRDTAVQFSEANTECVVDQSEKRQNRQRTH